MSSADNNPNADELLSAYLDGELTDAERALVEQLLAEDTDAQQTLAGLQSVSETLRKMPRATPGADLSEEVLERVQAERSTEPESVMPLPVGRSPRGWLWAGLTVAAALVIMVWMPEDQAKAPGDLAKRDAAAGDMRPEAVPAPGSSTPRTPAEMYAASEHAEPEAAVDAFLAEPTPVPVARPRPLTDNIAGEPGEESRLLLSPTVELDAMPRTSVAAPRRAATNAFGGRSADTTVANDSALLVVQVNLKPEAFEQGFVDQVFQTNGIVVAQDPSLTSDEPSSDFAVPSEPANEGPTPGSPLADGLATNDFANLAQREQTVINARNALPVEATADANRLVAQASRNGRSQVLLIECAAPQLAGVLDDLRNDFGNCNSLIVAASGRDSFVESTGEGAAEDESVTTEQNGGAQKAQQSAKALVSTLNGQNTREWLGYNRVAGATKGMPKAAMSKAASSKATTAADHASQTSKGSQAEQTQSAQAKVVVGNAYRLQSAELQQFAQQENNSGTRSTTRSGSAVPAIPAPTDSQRRVQALVIVESQPPADSPPDSPSGPASDSAP